MLLDRTFISGGGEQDIEVSYTYIAYDLEELEEKLKSYDKRFRPYNGEGPVNVTMQLFVQSLGPVQEHTFTYDIKFFHRQWWSDVRLAVNSSSEVTKVTLNNPPEEIIWIPDAVIVNSKHTERLSRAQRTVISSDGQVYVSFGTKATVTCVMNLTDYPMDTQMCPFIYESYAYSSTDVRLYWHEKAILWDQQRGLNLVGYDMKSISNSKDQIVQPIGENVEVYDNLIVFFKLERTFLFYFYRAYVPTIILMVFNCGSFWIPDKSIPERMTLIVTTFLSSAFIFQSVTDETVQVSYTTSMQLFLIVNICFIVGAIFEYLLVIRLKSTKTIGDIFRPKKILKDFAEGQINAIFQDVIGDQQCTRHKTRKFSTGKDNRTAPHFLDKTCRVLFPAVYILFCTFYFCYFLL